ncbi:MAG: hypothetical protein ACK55Z_18385, partial [bacterium]
MRHAAAVAASAPWDTAPLASPNSTARPAGKGRIVEIEEDSDEDALGPSAHELAPLPAKPAKGPGAQVPTPASSAGRVVKIEETEDDEEDVRATTQASKTSPNPPIDTPPRFPAGPRSPTSPPKS